MRTKMGRLGVLVKGALERSPDRLEHDAERALEVLEDGGLAIGPVVGCDFKQSVMEVCFSVEGPDLAAIERTTAAIIEKIDKAIGGRVQTSTTPAGQVEVVCA
jgi:hypothetical protein